MSDRRKLIRLDDDTLIEVEAAPNEVRQISSKAAKKVAENLTVVKPLLLRVCGPIVDAWSELSERTEIESAEVEIGLSFEAEGNVYITSAKAGANLTVKLSFKPKEPADR